MAGPIDYDKAKEILEGALGLAKSGEALPITWLSHARSVFHLDAKTWTPAFATLLLAKAANDEIDTLSLKIEAGNPSTYSARGLCHSVVVPAAQQHGFSIRNTGREPLNNQPFFRYDRIDKIDRVRNPGDREFFLEVAKSANELSPDAAFRALAAFLREALDVTAAAKRVKARTEGLTEFGARIAVEDFLRFDAPDRPHRLQAFAAACVDLVFDDVATRRINDPSRDLPGDVHAVVNGVTVLAVEVRGKTVSLADLASFATACESAGIGRAIVFVDAAGQQEFEVHDPVHDRPLPHIQLAVFTSASRLLADTLLWSRLSIGEAIQAFSRGLLDRLRAIEVSPLTLEEWTRAVAVARSR